MSKSIPDNHKLRFSLFALGLFALLLWTYSNHFHNPFQFDDDHTIVSNKFIRDIKNIPLFFKDVRTTSSLPASQTYRPFLTTLNAIDYWIGGKPEPDPFYYHISIFSSYVLLGILLFFFFRKIFDSSVEHRWNRYFALFAAGVYCLHAANAETINYIIARSDSFSTLLILLAFVIYQYKPDWRNKYIYLLPAIIGFFVKEPAMMFGFILFFYILLFEQQFSLKSLIQLKPDSTVKKIIRTVLPALIDSVLYYTLHLSMRQTTWVSGGGAWYYYLATQTFVIVHYIINFFLPLTLSADTDWVLFTSFTDERFIAGSIILIALLILAFRLSENKKTRPISFGIIWFFLALIPTSSVFSLAEVLNDHRTFFPYIGLVIATVWTAALFVIEREEKLKTAPFMKVAVCCIACLVILAHSYGTHQRNKVWNSAESLWYDVTVKSPNNARGLMNYGNSQMAKGNYAVARDYYQRALKLWPSYSYLYINMAVLKGAMGDANEAEQDFNKALSLNGFNPEGYYFYAKWLKGQGRIEEAKEIITKGLAVSPGHINSQKLFDEIATAESASSDNYKLVEQQAKENPTPENYLNLSLIYYKEQQYQECVDAAKLALKLRPQFAEAYNNICSAYTVMGNYKEAIMAANEALRIKPDFVLAKNNLADALARKAKEDTLLLAVKQKPTEANYINLSLHYYNNGLYLKCVETAELALAINPKSDLAYNNICAAYNTLKNWDKAIDAGERGLSINSNNQLLKNNLALARQKKAQL